MISRVDLSTRIAISPYSKSIVTGRHPDGRASTRFFQGASRPEGPCALLRPTFPLQQPQDPSFLFGRLRKRVLIDGTRDDVSQIKSQNPKFIFPRQPQPFPLRLSSSPPP